MKAAAGGQPQAGDAGLLTVVIPTCHRNDLLGLCLDRLAPGAQTLAAERYEVVVSDDGARGTAEEMVRTRYPWARWLEGPRRGPGANRNHGARQARGEWLVFTDDDCVPAAGWLTGFAAAARPGITVYEGKTTCEKGVSGPLEHAPENLNGGWLWSCNMMIARQSFTELAGFDEEFPHPHMEDVDFRERVLGSGREIAFVPEAVVDHPPRPVRTGVAMAKTHESEFLFYYKVGKRRPYVGQHLRRMCGFRVRGLLRSRDARQFARALGSFVVEMTYVAWHAPGWQRKYRNRYAAAPGPVAAYPPDLFTRVGMR